MSEYRNGRIDGVHKVTDVRGRCIGRFWADHHPRQPELWVASIGIAGTKSFSNAESAYGYIVSHSEANPDFEVR